MQNAIHFNALVMGVCYYPEHWDESLWQSDLQRMKQCGIRVIRIAEFAWNKFEPEEGIFTFDFFDRFLSLAAQEGMQVIFCTPTATPPAWASHNYPEILNTNMQGVPFYHGERRHYHYNSPKYNALCAAITEQLAMHYANHPAIIGWQLDNEINCHVDVFYSEGDSVAFRAFVREKYGTLDALNEAWGTVFWNQTYTDWAQIFVPRNTIDDANNPHHVLDYNRFVSHSGLAFLARQSEILRKYIGKDVFITTNGMFDRLDNHKMTDESLDFYTYDSYPNMAFELAQTTPRPLKDRQATQRLAEVRSISRRFGIMEQQSGASGWLTSQESTAPKPGQATLWTMQSIAHGANFISYFRWRTATMGTEIYWHGILDYCNRDNRRLAEITDIHRKMQAISAVAGADYLAEVAYLRDYDNLWDADFDVYHKRVEQQSYQGWFAAAQHAHTPMDYHYLRDTTTLADLAKYKLLVYAHPTIVTEAQVALLTAYVAQGGTLLIGCRAGYKDSTGKCVMTPMPGLLSGLCGATVEEFTFVHPTETSTADWAGTSLPTPIFNDVLEPLDSIKGTVLATYQENYYAGKPALVCNETGLGKTYYFGATFGEETARVFLQQLGLAAPFADVVTAPEACEIAVRAAGDAKYIFVLNYTAAPCTITLHKPLRNTETNELQQGEQALAPYQVVVYTID